MKHDRAHRRRTEREEEEKDGGKYIDWKCLKLEMCIIMIRELNFKQISIEN